MTKSSQTNRGPRFLTIKEVADLLERVGPDQIQDSHLA